MKYLILLSVLLFSISGWSQDINYNIDGRISNDDNGGYEGGVTITVLNNGAQVTSTTTSSNGKYSLKFSIPVTDKFELVYAKSGLVSKKISLDASKVNAEDLNAGNEMPLPPLRLGMFAEREGIDFSFLETEYVGELKYSPSNMGMSPDIQASEAMKAKINNLLLKAEKDKAELEKNYTEAMFQADAAYEAKEYPKALEKYQEANGYKSEEEKPKTRIIELEALIKAQEEASAAQNANNEAYDNLISEADALKKADSREAAVEKYKEAIKIKDETYPKDQVAFLTKQFEDEKKENESQVAYDAAMKSGESFMIQKSYRSAKDKFTEALKLKSNEKLPKSKLEEIEALLNAAQQEESEKKQYDDAIAAADVLFNKEDWFGAKDKYALALSYESSSSYAKGRKKICEDNFASQEEEIAKLEKLNALLNTGFE